MPIATDRRSAIVGLAGLLAWPGAARADGTGDDPVSTAITVEDGRVWVAATIGASKPLLFIIDTGGALQAIRPAVAASLKLRVLGGETIHGLGRTPPRGALVVARELRFASGLVQPETVFTTFDFGPAQPDMAGTLAAGLFTTRDSELDFEAGQWRLWRDGRSDFSGLTRMAARVADARRGYSTRLIATASLDGQGYRLLLDTGAGGVLLYPRAARRSGLWDDARPFAPAPTRGFGGLAARPSRVVRALRLDMAPLALDRPLVTLMDPGQAMAGADDHDGLLGLQHLQLLTLATQVRAGALWARRNGRAPLPERYALSGLWLDRGADGRAVVRTVGTGSPAAAAGMRAGEVIADPPSFDAALRAVRQPEVDIVAVGPAGPQPRRWTARGWL